jgi:hypothetical protein
MKKMQYKTEVNASAQKAYLTMLGINDVALYQQWTAEFNPTSTYEGSWEKGSKILFIGVSEDGKRGGMIARVVENVPNKFVSLQHYGIVNGDEEIFDGPDVEKWAGSFENYTFQESQEKTTITVEMDVMPEYLDYFDETYPKALNKLKEIIEQV